MTCLDHLPEAESKLERLFDLLHALWGEGGDEVAEVRLGNGLKTVQIDRAELEEPVILTDDDFRGHVADGGGDGRHREGVKDADAGVASEDQDGSSLVRGFEAVPPDKDVIVSILEARSFAPALLVPCASGTETL